MSWLLWAYIGASFIFYEMGKSRGNKVMREIQEEMLINSLRRG